MTRPELVIFDYDGVVADSEVMNNAAMAEVLTAIGLETSLEDALATYVGKRWRDCEPMIAERLGRPCPPTVLADWTRLCETRAGTSLEAVRGLHGFVEALDGPRCIASSSPPDWIERGLARFGLTDRLGPIFSAAVHVERGKPHPDLFLFAADAFKADPRATVVLEDSVTGVLAGAAAGMRVIGLCAGGHVRDGHADRLRAAGATDIAHSYEEVKNLLG